MIAATVSVRPIVAAYLLASCFVGSVAASTDDSDIAVHVRKHGEWVTVHVELSLQATASETWNVMTDYDNMARFIPGLQTSRILERSGNTLIVLQQGRASRGPLTFHSRTRARSCLRRAARSARAWSAAI